VTVIPPPRSGKTTPDAKAKTSTTKSIFSNLLSSKPAAKKPMSEFDRRKAEEELKIEDKLKKIDQQELATSKARENKELLLKRGQKLNETADKAEQLSNAAGNFFKYGNCIKKQTEKRSIMVLINNHLTNLYYY